MSPKQQRGEATVEQVLDAALRVYAASGDQGLTVSAVTKASGVSLGSLYHHFGSLDGLVASLVLRWLSRLLSEVSGALARTRTAHTGIRAVVRAYLGFVRDHPDAARLVHSVAADRYGMAHAKEIRDSQEARLSPVAEWIRKRIDSGELAPLPVPVIESLVLGPVVGVARRWLTIGDIDLEGAVRDLPDRIWRSVSP
ncbi:TetR/AcrR family transcriptional regulator [Streptomyces sp. NPDC048248]|uniref:TetR/AcrR family transcriptional regulator n=1 Tax=Streptomyces sp. NPDC048248 TaxID=3365523 RepID=UPI0037106E14